MIVVWVESCVFTKLSPPHYDGIRCISFVGRRIVMWFTRTLYLFIYFLNPESHNSNTNRRRNVWSVEAKTRWWAWHLSQWQVRNKSLGKAPATERNCTLLIHLWLICSKAETHQDTFASQLKRWYPKAWGNFFSASALIFKMGIKVQIRPTWSENCPLFLYTPRWMDTAHFHSLPSND